MSNQEESETSNIRDRIKLFERNIIHLQDSMSPLDDNQIAKINALFPNRSIGRLDIEEMIKKSGESNEFSMLKIEEKHECWICLQEETDSPFVKPCSCKGGTQYVHYNCFNDFLATKKNIDDSKCSFCKRKYMIRTPKYFFLKFYEFFGKVNRLISNSLFIISGFLLVYSVVLAYGFSILFLFFGKKEILNYLYTKDESTGTIISFNYLNCIRTFFGAPMIPVVLLSSTHCTFRKLIHIVSPLFFVGNLKKEYIIMVFTPITLYLYFKGMSKILKKLGKVDFTDDTGIMFNDHYLIVTKLVNGIMIPFVGLLIGRVFLKFSAKFIFKFFGFDFSSFDTNESIRFWSFLGILIYIISCDILCIIYLIFRKKKVNNIIIHENNRS